MFRPVLCVVLPLPTEGVVVILPRKSSVATKVMHPPRNQDTTRSATKNSCEDGWTVDRFYFTSRSRSPSPPAPLPLAAVVPHANPRKHVFPVFGLNTSRGVSANTFGSRYYLFGVCFESENYSDRLLRLRWGGVLCV